MRMSHFWGITLAGAIGCGGAASAPDFNALETTLTQPTGTLAAGAEPMVIGGYNDQAASASSGFGASSGADSVATPGGLATSALDPLGTPTSQWCPALDGKESGSCSCPGGGSVTFDLSAVASLSSKGETRPMGPIDATASINASRCTVDDQTTDGSLYYRVKALQADLRDLLLIYALHYTQSPPEKRVDVDYLIKEGRLTFAIQVQDGTVLVSAQGSWDKSTRSGTLVITDKNGTWTCTLANAKGMCSDGKGTTRSVT